MSESHNRQRPEVDLSVAYNTDIHAAYYHVREGRPVGGELAVGGNDHFARPDKLLGTHIRDHWLDRPESVTLPERTLQPSLHAELERLDNEYWDFFAPNIQLEDDLIRQLQDNYELHDVLALHLNHVLAYELSQLPNPAPADRVHNLVRALKQSVAFREHQQHPNVRSVFEQILHRAEKAGPESAQVDAGRSGQMIELQELDIDDDSDTITGTGH